MGASSPTGTGFKTRLTQDEKTAETRRRLLDAAIGCLVERGYANTTTSEIAERAGLSRGAQLYHFPNKEELLTKAVEHLYGRMIDDLKEKIGRRTNVNDRRSVAIDLMWESATGRLATAWIELVVASRTDAYLLESMKGANDRLAELTDKTVKGIFSRPQGARGDH